MPVAPRRVFLILLLLAGAGELRADEPDGVWTNHAGHVLKAVPQAIHGQTVTFQAEGKRKLDLPITVFTPSEQERLRTTLHDTTLPPALQDAGEFARRSIKRSRLLLDHDQATQADHDKVVEETIAAFRLAAEPLVKRQQLRRERLDLIIKALKEGDTQ